MKRFYDDFKDHVNKIVNYEMKPMDPLTDEEKASYENNKYVISVKKNSVLIIKVKYTN